jgi:hypothetical protein
MSFFLLDHISDIFYGLFLTFLAESVPQAMKAAFLWFGKRYLWHIPSQGAEYGTDFLLQKEITLPSVETQDKSVFSGNIDTISESFKHKFFNAHRFEHFSQIKCSASA